jgi:hypothetical protein
MIGVAARMWQCGAMLRLADRRSVWLVFWGLVALGLGGCGGAKLASLDLLVEGATARDYDRWLYRHSRELCPDLESRLTKGLSQLKLEIGIANPLMGRDQVGRIFHRQIDGATVGQVLAYVDLIEIHRLGLQNLIDHEVHRANHRQLIALQNRGEFEAIPSVLAQIQTIEQRSDEREARIEGLLDGVLARFPGLDTADWEPSVPYQSDMPAALVAKRIGKPSDLGERLTEAQGLGQ